MVVSFSGDFAKSEVNVDRALTTTPRQFGHRRLMSANRRKSICIDRATPRRLQAADFYGFIFRLVRVAGRPGVVLFGIPNGSRLAD
jgi:hypothetical protein